MRTRPLVAGLAWIAATTMGAAVVWVGLRPVLEAAVPDRSVPLSAADLRQLANHPPIPLPVPSRITTPGNQPGGPATAPPPGDGTTTPGSAPGTVAPAGPTTPPPTAPTPGLTSPTPPPPSDAPAAAPVTTSDGWLMTTGPDGTVTYQRSFATPGGTAVIRMVPGRVSLVSATPNADYTVRVTQDGPERLVVQFLATGTADIIDAIWWVDHPYAEVSHL